MSLAIKFQNLILTPFILGLFCENICDSCILCEVVQNASDIRVTKIRIWSFTFTQTVNSSFLKLLLVAFFLVKWNKSQSWELLNFSTAVSAKCISFRELPTGLVFAVPVNFLIRFPAENFFCTEQFDFFPTGSDSFKILSSQTGFMKGSFLRMECLFLSLNPGIH